MRDAPTILHVDLDAFFASVEQRDYPELRGQPVLVGGSRERGVVAAASYEARTFGVHSAMPMAEALRRCPQAVVVPHRMSRYVEASNEFFAILGDFSPLVEGISVDEAFIDVAGSERLLGAPDVIGRKIKDRVRGELQLVASVGIAPTKFVAKIASDIDKPDGLRQVLPAEVLGFLHPLPTSRLWGVGKIAQGKLAELGLHTIGEVARYPEALLCRRLGPSLGAHVARLSRGQDSRGINGEREAVSIGQEQTFERDRQRADELMPTLLAQTDKVAARLRRADLRARVVVLKIKYADFRSITRQKTLTDPTSDGLVLGKAIKSLLDGVEVSGLRGKHSRVRLCGVAVAQLESRNAPRQLTMDEDKRARGEKLGDAIDQLESRYGAGTIVRADAHEE